MMASAKARAHLIITGRVQGVAFRYSTRDKAGQLGICGWVRNRRDGTVEAVAEGDRDAVDGFIKWCHKGPPLARVASVDVQWEDFKGEFKNFFMAQTV